MGLNVSRTTEPLRFDVGIGSAGYADVISSPGEGAPQKSLLPGATTVSQAVDELFGPDRSAKADITRALVAGNSASLRTSGGFAQAAHDALTSLRSRGSEAADRAAHEIENLLADTDLFEHYRMSLLET